MTVAKAWVYSPGARAQAVSLLEALSCGAVLALARENFVSPFLRDGENVLLLEEQSAGDFALALERLNNTALLHKIRQEARETVLRNFAQERVLPMQTRFLETCTGHGRSRGHRVLAQSCKWRGPSCEIEATRKFSEVAGSFCPGQDKNTSCNHPEDEASNIFTSAPEMRQRVSGASIFWGRTTATIGRSIGHIPGLVFLSVAIYL